MEKINNTITLFNFAFFWPDKNELKSKIFFNLDLYNLHERLSIIFASQISFGIFS